jgi:hypothetical protein
MSLMKTAHWLTTLIVAVTILLVTQGSAHAQSGDVQYFPQTGHNVRGVFLQLYKAAKDPILIYGYPITEQIKSKDGKTVQYFQRARFELTNGQTIQLTALGRITYPAKPPAVTNNTNGCETFPTGYSVCYTFLDFYKANGGAKQFGNPISPFEVREGMTVQYFEGARFEWHADRPAGQWVVISDLGRIYFDQLGEDPAYLKPLSPLDATINPVLSLNVRGFVLKAVTRKSGEQTVYVIVHDQKSQAVTGATGKAVIHLSGGKTQELTFTTEASGIAKVSFDFADQTPGDLIAIDITVNYQGITGTTTTSFRVWF